MKMKTTFVILYTLVEINLMILKASAYSMPHLNTSYRRKGLIFLFEQWKSIIITRSLKLWLKILPIYYMFVFK